MFPGHWASTEPNRPAIVMGADGQTITYGELAGRTNQLARYCSAAGLVRGDHIAVLMENRPEFFQVAWAALLSGLYVTPINWHLTPEEIAYVLADSESRVLVSSSAMAKVLGGMDFDKLGLLTSRLSVGGGVDGFADYSIALDAFSAAPLDELSSGAPMLYTSGTTGRPKGVIRPLPDRKPDTPDPAMAGFERMFGIDMDSVYLSPAPLYHAAPLLATLAVHRVGGTVVVMERFDAEHALALIEKHQVTVSQWVPTMFVRMLALPQDVRAKYDLSSMKLAIHAAAPCPPAVKRDMIAWWGPIILEYYSGTDSGGGMTMINSTDWLSHPGSVGRGSEIRIVGDDGEALPPGEIGTVYFVGGSEFSYKGDPDKTERSRLPGGLTTMGDCGYLDDEGFLYLTDRKDFMILRGGVNVYPQEIEDRLVQHPLVADAAVFGVPHPDLGEEVKAAIELAEGGIGTDDLAAELQAYCRETLASYKCPKFIDFVDELPRTPAGKLMKRLLRDKHWPTADPK